MNLAKSVSNIRHDKRKFSKCKFISFDTKDLQPTINTELLSKSLSYAETKIQITEDSKKIYHLIKSLLFEKENTWVKKGRDLFNAAMGVGTFLLGKITEICNKSEIGL